MTTAQKKTPRALRLNSVSVPMEAFFHLVLGLFSLLCIIPFVFVVIIALSSEDSIKHIGYSFIPEAWSLAAFKQVLGMGDVLWRSYFNSFFVTIVGTVISVAMCVLYAYPLFRKDFKYRNFFSFFSFFTMIFGGGLIPTYIVCRNLLGLGNNYAALIVPMLVSPFNIIIMRTFFQTSVPFDLIEAATIDGSGEYSTLWRIILPIVKPGIATVALLTALAYWNEWFLCLLYVTERSLYPLQYLLMEMQRNAEFLARNSSMIGAASADAIMRLPNQTMRMATVVFIVVPIACAYPFFQRYVVAGLTVGSVKG
ncbi:ABC transporter permease subunit [Beduinella massiliensis]|uniref:ABC transporter permease subunit n=1 Tax=Beduinella massiliensis TaxID=1852363 RepID=UPI000C85500A